MNVGENCPVNDCNLNYWYYRYEKERKKKQGEIGSSNTEKERVKEVY